MKWPLFENKIKQELSGHRAEVDIDALWKSIEPEVDAINRSRRKNRRGFFWLFLAGASLLAGGAGFYFWNQTSGSPAINNPTLPVGDAVATAENNARDFKNPELIVAENKLHSIDPPSGRGETGSKPNTSASPTGHPTWQTFTPDGIKKPLKKSAETGAGFSGQPEQPLGSSLSVSSEKKALQEGNSGTAGEMGKNVQADALNLPYALPLPGIPFFKTGENIGKTGLSETSNPKSNVNPVAASAEETPTPPRKKQFHFSLAANGGISFTKRELSLRDSVSTDLLNIRERTEKQLETSHFGLQFNTRHRSGLEFTTGLQYTRIVELFNYNEKITRTDSIIGVAYYAINPNNDTIPVMDLIPRTTHTTILKKYYNRYTMLDIPVLVGFYKEKYGWVYGVQTGIFANISLKATGRVLHNDIEDEAISSRFKSRVGISYYIGLGGGYKFGNNLEINVSPYLRYFPGDFAKDSYPISQKYTLVGMDARIRYWF